MQQTRRTLSALALLLVVAVLGSLVAAQWNPLLDLDHSAVRGATDVSREHPALVDALEAWSWLTMPWRLYLVAAVIAVWAAWKGLWRRALWAVPTVVLGWWFAALLKLLVGRERPAQELAVGWAPGLSFPSGHAANAAIFATVVLLLIAPAVTRRTLRAAAWVLGALVLLTCLDRVFLGVHHPSDVIAGVAFGVGFVLLSALVLPRRERPDQSRLEYFARAKQ